MDFWMRNPDYLAAELIELFENTGTSRYLAFAADIFRTEEPDIRRFPMIRYRFGAFERVDDALSILRLRDLIRITGRKVGDRVLETDFLLTQAAVDLTEAVVRDFPGLKWYADRARLVAELAGDRGGAALKQQQYERASYAETQLGGVIPSIAKQTQARIVELLGTSALDGNSYGE
jgi:hypothetical protein